jgi:hypothetical protein
MLSTIWPSKTAPTAVSIGVALWASAPVAKKCAATVSATQVVNRDRGCSIAASLIIPAIADVESAVARVARRAIRSARLT